MQRDSQLLTMFRSALTGAADGLRTFAAALEENNNPLAPLARELAAAVADVPADLLAVFEPAFLARGTGWRIEYRPGKLAKKVHPDLPLMQGGENAEVGEVYEGEGPWTDLEGEATMLAPAGARCVPSRFCSLQEEASPKWVRAAFDGVRFNMLGNLLVGHQVAMVMPGQASVHPILPAVDYRIKWLENQGR